MQTSPSMALEHLAKGSLLTLRDAQGRGVVVFSGSLWITQEGDLRDTVVEAGESLHFDRDGLVVVEALADTRLLRLDPANAPAARLPLRAQDAISVHEQARRQRSQAIGDWLMRLIAPRLRPRAQF